MTQDYFSYHDEIVPDDHTFRELRSQWRKSVATNDDLHRHILRLQQAMDQHRYTYQFDWLGVPIVRLPDDIVVLQEIITEEKPDCIIETGIARGGSLILNASLQFLAGVQPNVLGVDINIFPHTRQAIGNSSFARDIALSEGDSAGSEVQNLVRTFIGKSEKSILILDSDHSHSHVLAELMSLAPLLPIGSIIMVADTIVEEMPLDYYPNRHWGPGNSPLSATYEFLSQGCNFVIEPIWNRRALITEFRDGILRKVA